MYLTVNGNRTHYKNVDMTASGVIGFDCKDRGSPSTTDHVHDIPLKHTYIAVDILEQLF